jgi:hypothetical protein
VQEAAVGESGGGWMVAVTGAEAQWGIGGSRSSHLCEKEWRMKEVEQYGSWFNSFSLDWAVKHLDALKHNINQKFPLQKPLNI